MRNITKTLIFFSLLIVIGTNVNLFAQSSARYTVTFTGLWNSTDHGTLPDNDHWSNLVGGTHNSNVTFWELGQLATNGIENVAEVGNNDAFLSEFNTAITNGDADQWVQEAFSPNEAMGNCVIMDIIVTEEFPLLTLASMIAPSPDWFVGINSFSLLDGTNNWKTSIPPIDMFPYDAGTEEGTGYSMNNSASSPHIPIFSRVNMTPFNDQPVGTLSIVFEELLSVDGPSLEQGIKISPNPANSVISITNHTQRTISNVSIFDILGNLVVDIKDNLGSSQINIDRNELRSGLYLVQITSVEGKSTTKKLLLN
ncbi:MAG: T9SS type A sorting domain-containing protein [Flavobacteriaceae bacterium]|nr:T9SS type A sorting domain-containing protein [Flavobacteriaceae bacterium]